MMQPSNGRLLHPSSLSKPPQQMPSRAHIHAFGVRVLHSLGDQHRQVLRGQHKAVSFA